MIEMERERGREKKKDFRIASPSNTLCGEGFELNSNMYYASIVKENMHVSFDIRLL
jgi:hypothetical protein